MKKQLYLYLPLFLCMMILLPAISLAQNKPVPPNTLREADVVVSKRLWRIIDLREKQNYVAIWPGNPINKLLYQAVLSGKLIPYTSDSLRGILPLEKFALIGSDTSFVKNIIDPNDPEWYRTDTVVDQMNPELRIKHLLVMEEWYFDRKLSTTIPRIVAIAPLYNAKFSGADIGLQPLCWLKYFDRYQKENDCRDFLANQYVFNKENSLSKFSFDDWFEQRRFNSFIIKESNQYDISIMDDPDIKKNGLAALIEAARIKQEQFQKSDDVFEE